MILMVRTTVYVPARTRDELKRHGVNRSKLTSAYWQERAGHAVTRLPQVLKHEAELTARVEGSRAIVKAIRDVRQQDAAWRTQPATVHGFTKRDRLAWCDWRIKSSPGLKDAFKDPGGLLKFLEEQDRVDSEAVALRIAEDQALAAELESFREEKDLLLKAHRADVATFLERVLDRKAKWSREKLVGREEVLVFLETFLPMAEDLLYTPDLTLAKFAELLELMAAGPPDRAIDEALRLAGL